MDCIDYASLLLLLLLFLFFLLLARCLGFLGLEVPVVVVVEFVVLLFDPLMLLFLESVPFELVVTEFVLLVVVAGATGGALSLIHI